MKIVTIAVSLTILGSIVVLSTQQRNPLIATLPTGIRMDFVRIPPGEFMMGCSPKDNECEADEKPAHRVRITRGFEMAKYEVTSAQWLAVSVTSPFVPIPGSGDDHAILTTRSRLQ